MGGASGCASQFDFGVALAHANLILLLGSMGRVRVEEGGQFLKQVEV